ncbi:hypothetical protein RIF29_29602 [Crotalaria pallida]|uniref:Uncharacterized protein n=1 Tax=Crotalaria pallida TaxID=3830 RepID=A0AAN9HXL4_CROPI
MRQFGIRQHIPLQPSQPGDLHQLTLRGKQNINWENRLQDIINKWNNKNKKIQYSEQQNVPLGIQSEYMMWYLRITRHWMTEYGASQGHVADGIERINYLCSPEGRRDDVPIETYLAEMKLETDHMLVSMNQANRCYLSIQEAPAASHDPDITNVDGVLPNTSRERGGLGHRRRHEPAIERQQQSPIDWKPGMYYAPQPYPYLRIPGTVRNLLLSKTAREWPRYMSMPQIQGYNTASPYDPVTSTPSAPTRWDRETVSPSIDFYELAGTSAPQIDLNTQLFDESNDHNDNQDARRNPHRGARDHHWRCGT